MKDEGKPNDHMIACEGCGTAVPGYDVVNYGSMGQGYRELCTGCFNAEVARILGLESFENVRLQPVAMTDCAGERHEFHFRMRLLGSVEGVALDAFELKDGAPSGYQFQMLGKPDEDPLKLLGRLIERMRRSLSVKHLVRGEYGTRIAVKTVCGRIDWDEFGDGQFPLLVIDGREMTWDTFGRLLMTYEDWQFRLTIRDNSEEV